MARVMPSNQKTRMSQEISNGTADLPTEPDATAEKSNPIDKQETQQRTVNKAPTATQELPANTVDDLILKRVSEIENTISKIEGHVSPGKWWQWPITRRLGVLLSGLLLLCLLDFRSSAELKVPAGSSVSLVKLPEPDWAAQFPNYDEQTLSSMLPQLRQFWSIQDLPDSVSRLPLFEIQLNREGLNHGRGFLVVDNSSGESIARIQSALTVNGPTEIRLEALNLENSQQLEKSVLRTTALQVGHFKIPLTRIVQDSNGDGVFKVTVLPPIGIDRLKYNLEKAWSLCF